MTEWEQIKSEYREIPVPADGPHQVLHAMAKAKKKRNRFKHIARYGTVAAAVLLVILIVPGMFLFSGGFGSADNESIEYDCATESTGAADYGYFKSDANMAPATNCAPDMEYGVTEDCVETTLKSKAEGLWAGKEEAISSEILSQMEERMLKHGETYYIRSEEYPMGFELISEKQEYYINEAGLLVIVFREGEVAPAEQGCIEFVIPAEVFAP